MHGGVSNNGGGSEFSKSKPDPPHIIQNIRECSLVTGMGWCFPRGVDVFLIAFFWEGGLFLIRLHKGGERFLIAVRGLARSRYTCSHFVDSSYPFNVIYRLN